MALNLAEELEKGGFPAMDSSTALRFLAEMIAALPAGAA